MVGRLNTIMLSASRSIRATRWFSPFTSPRVVSPTVPATVSFQSTWVFLFLVTTLRSIFSFYFQKLDWLRSFPINKPLCHLSLSRIHHETLAPRCTLDSPSGLFSATFIFVHAQGFGLISFSCSFLWSSSLINFRFLRRHFVSRCVIGVFSWFFPFTSPFETFFILVVVLFRTTPPCTAILP